MNNPFDHALPPYLADYDLAPPLEVAAAQQGVNNASTIVRAGDGDYIARAYISKSYDDPASIGYEHHLLNRLADARLSFAVPVPIPTRNGARDFVSAQGRFGVIWGARASRPSPVQCRDGRDARAPRTFARQREFASSTVVRTRHRDR